MRQLPSYIRQGLDCRAMVKSSSWSGMASRYWESASQEATHVLVPLSGAQVATLTMPDNGRWVSQAQTPGLSRQRTTRARFIDMRKAKSAQSLPKRLTPCKQVHVVVWWNM